MSSMTLEQLIEQDGQDVISFSKEKTKGPYKSPFNVGEAYTVRVDNIVGAINNLGYWQMEVSTSIVRSDGSTVRGGKDWINLSIQPEEIQAQLGETYAERMATNHKKLVSFFAAFSPEFRAYASIDKSSKDWTYMDEDGNAIGAAELKQRKDSVAKKLSAVIRHLSTVGNTVDFMTGATGVKVVVEGNKANKKGEMPLFTNFYSSIEAANEAGHDTADI